MFQSSGEGEPDNGPVGQEGLEMEEQREESGERRAVSSDPSPNDQMPGEVQKTLCG